METYLRLLSSLERELKELQPFNPFDCEIAEKGINLCRNTLACMRKGVVKKGFRSQEKECRFFKTVKPQVVGSLIFYMNCIHLSLNRPTVSAKETKEFYSGYIVYLRGYFGEHRQLYHYYMRGHSHRDLEYFTRQDSGIPVYADSLPYLLDAQFSTAKDMVFAQIIGNLKTIELLSGQMTSNKEKALSQASPLKWTGQKVDLVELVYALQASGLINNGNVGIKDLATALEQLFNVEVGDYYRIFLEIRMRKSNQSKLLDFLKTSLHNRIIEVDG